MVAHAAIVWWWLRPLLSHLSSALPGTHAADNVTFVWNLWWMRYVLHHPGLSFFSTAFLFYPVGTDLTVHTHTALPAFAAAVAGPSSLVASQNLLIVAHLFLNFVCSYALAYRLTRDAGAAFVASIVFGASPFIGAHLLGHFNLIAAWTLPLVVLLCDRTLESGSRLAAVICGVMVGAAGYIDYYLLIYGAALLVVLFAARSIHQSDRPAAPTWVPGAMKMIIALLAFDLLLISGIALAHTDHIIIGAVRISVRTLNNPITAAWILLVSAALLWVAGRTRVSYVRPPDNQKSGAIALTFAVALCVMLPLVVNGFALWRGGRYVSQEYRWRSAPGGVDVATFVLGNPSNAWWGRAVRHAYSAFHVDAVENAGWIPVGALGLAVIAIVVRRHDVGVREWIAAACVFLVWALGPWLMLFGRQSPLVLPSILVRYIPVVANARIPGRAMVVVYLACALLAAHAITWLLARGRRGRALAWMCAIVIVIDCAPASPPIFFPSVPARYAALNGAPGAVCELPLGLRDGFGEVGRFDSAVLLYQTVHQRPILGGFVARLPRSVVREYSALPVVSALLHLSSGGRLNDEPRGDARTNTMQLAALGVSYIVVDTRAASTDLKQYVETALALRAVGEEDGRAFYEVPR